MFKNLLRELEKIKREGQVAIPINPDSKGYLDKECPNEDCLFAFKVFGDDWKEKVSDEEVHCPRCGHTAKSDCWWTTEQLKEAGQKAGQHLSGRITKAMKKDARDLRRIQSPNSFIQMSLKVKGNSNTYILPIPAIAELEQERICSNCKTRYAVVGSAFFCPCCGHNSAIETFSDTINNIVKSIKNIEVIREAVSQINKDEAENTCRSLIEKGLLDCVSSFQRFCEVTYTNDPNAKENIPTNAFQKLDSGGNLWTNLIGESYTDWLSVNEFKRLKILFQRRHLLQHTEGIVDQKYLDKSGDISYKLNQRIVTKERDVLELVGYVKKLYEKIKEILSK